MSTLFADGRIVELIVALIVLEAVVLTAYHRRTGRGIALRDLLGNLLAGVFLLLALRVALAGADWPWVGLCLTAALAAHLVDLRRRWHA